MLVDRSSGMRMVEWCDKENFDTLPASFSDRELRAAVKNDMTWEERATFVELVPTAASFLRLTSCPAAAAA